MKETKREIRQSNFELMRIVSMVMIIVWHIIIYGKLEGLTGNYKVFFDFLQAFLIVHVNSFLLLMGYFQYNKKMKIKKAIELLSASWFYRIVLTLIFVFCGIAIVSSLDFFKALFPLDMIRNYWFIEFYVLIYLFSPYFNLLIEKMTQKQFRKLLLLGFATFSILPMISGDLITSNGGYTVLQFVMMYFLGAYLGKYKVTENFHFKYYSKPKLQTIFFISYFLFGFLNLAVSSYGSSLAALDQPLLSFLGNNIQSRRLTYSNPIVILQTVCYFEFFSTLTFRSKKINRLSAYCLGAYLLTEHFLVQPWLYQFLKVDITHFFGLRSMLRIFIVSVIILLTGILVEFLRKSIAQFLAKRKPFVTLKQKISSFVANY